MVGTAAEPLLQLRGVSKSYGGVAALSQVDFTAKASSIHAVLGENGAGKSTLIKVVAGVVQPDAGVMTSTAAPCSSRRRRTPTPSASSASSRNCR